MYLEMHEQHQLLNMQHIFQIHFSCMTYMQDICQIILLFTRDTCMLHTVRALYRAASRG